MTTASVTFNRVSVGLQPPVYAALYHEARRNGVRIPELLRTLLYEWAEKHPTGERRGE